MALTQRWAGKAYGTNIGNVFLRLEGDDQALSGTLRMNEPGVAVAVYAVQGSFEAPTLTLTGQSQVQVEGLEFGDLTATGTLNGKGEIHGDWETSIGTAGTFVLFPHIGGEQPDDSPVTEQFHVARHNFGVIEIDRDQIIEVAENIRRDFPQVIVTVVAGTEQALYLDDFKKFPFTVDRAEMLKIFARKPDERGGEQIISIEFGPHVNQAATQGANRAWVLGQLETLKQDLKQYERSYITNFKRWGLSLNQFLLLGAIVLLPSFSSLGDRAIFMGAGLALIVGVNFLHSRYLSFAAIHLREKKKGLLKRFGPSAASWFLGIVATVIAALVGAYLQGWLALPSQSEAPRAIEASPSNVEDVSVERKR